MYKSAIQVLVKLFTKSLFLPIIWAMSFVKLYFRYRIITESSIRQETITFGDRFIML